MGILEKISEIEKEIARTQKNKGKTINFTGKNNLNIILTKVLSIIITINLE